MAQIGNAGLLEREAQLAELLTALREARDGRGRLVLVEGAAGIGKTRLLDDVREKAAADGTQVLRARASELDREFPFGVVRQLFDPFLQVMDDDRRERLLQGAAAPAAALVGGGPLERVTGGGSDPSAAHFHALYWLTANVAEEAPLALVIDDVHWADGSSLRFLQFLLPRLDGLPVLVALAGRPREAGMERHPIDALAADAFARVVRPQPLTLDGVAMLIRAQLGVAPEAAFVEACLTATSGNPFLLVELLRALAADAISPTADHAEQVGRLAPATIARAVVVRLMRLGEDAAALARAVAILGGTAPMHRAARLAGLRHDRAEGAASALESAEILAGTRPLGFVHPIVRAAVYGDVGATERAAAHRRAADLLADEGARADAIAPHLLAAEPTGESAVVATLREAATRARANGAASVAAACLARALAEPPEPAERPGLLLALASAELHAGRPEAAVARFAEGVRASEDPRARAECAWEWAVALQALGRHDEAFEVREQAAEGVVDVEPELAAAIEAGLVASASLDLSRLGWARERLARVRDDVAATPAGRRLAATAAYLEAMYGDERAEPLAARADRALASGELHGSTAFFSAVEVLWLADRGDAAQRALDDAVDAMRREGSAFGFACACAWRALLLAREGRLEEAEADARACSELAIPQGWFTFAPPALGYVLQVLLDRGELDYAEHVLVASGMGERAPGDDLTLHPMVHARARLRAARGDVAGARADMAGLALRGARWNTAPSLVPAFLAAPEAAVDDRREARERGMLMLDQGRRWGTSRAIGMAQRAVGLVEGGSSGLMMLEEAVATLEGTPARPEHARALADLGAALRRAGRRAAARDPLRRALDLADACGARPLAEATRRELRAAGGRPRRPRISGIDALTASERRIAKMAGGGLSNREIAQALFVTKKTVETHLSNAYRKLGISARGQLPAALREGHLESAPYGDAHAPDDRGRALVSRALHGDS